MNKTCASDHRQHLSLHSLEPPLRRHMTHSYHTCPHKHPCRFPYPCYRQTLHLHNKWLRLSKFSLRCRLFESGLLPRQNPFRAAAPAVQSRFQFRGLVFSGPALPPGFLRSQPLAPPAPPCPHHRIIHSDLHHQ